MGGSSGSDDSRPNFRIEYPSGIKFSQHGRFELRPLGDMLCPIVIVSDSRVLFLDQRAIVSLEGHVVYSPRRNLDGLEKEMMQWIMEHPE